MDICGLREGFSLRKYQAPLVEETLKEFEEKAKQNVFIFLPQGTQNKTSEKKAETKEGRTA